jgi:hypothetical protein
VRRVFALAALALGACGKLQGFGGPEPPLVTFNISFTGDLTPLRPPGITSEQSLQVAVIWGAQWLTEPFCFLPAESPEAAAVIAAGCRDTFGFVPNRVDQATAIAADGTASLPLDQLPTADVLVGDVTARVAYGSLVVYDDRDGNGLQLSQPQHTPSGGDRGDRGNDNGPDSADVIYGASFLTMTSPDRRVAYREGAFNQDGAFYPRAGCGPPLPAFSIVSAGGFSPASALTATLMGTLPQEPLGTCTELAPSATTVDIAAQMPSAVEEVGCDERTDDGSSRYRQPPTDDPDPNGLRTKACAHIPAFDLGNFSLDGGTSTSGADGGASTGGDGGADGGASASSLIQLVVSGRTTDKCKGLTHYTLRGCRESVTCALPDWDFTASPPSWWPCPH